MTKSGAAGDAAVPHVNEVHLVGRLAAEPEQRELPSGDVIVVFRIVVSRTGATRGATGRLGPTVDTLDGAAWRRGAQRALLACGAGDVVEVSGALRRRFWRGEQGPVSRSEVEVASARRRSRAPAREVKSGVSR